MAKGRIIGVVLVLVVLAGFTWVALFGMKNNTQELPSALIGRAFPAFDLPSVNDPQQRITEQDLIGKPAIINVWASWCVECLRELPTLSKLSKQGVAVYGINYKDDDQETINKWLTEFDQPYQINIKDSGSLGINLGVYGAPETFLIDKKGVIRFKLIGLVSDENWRKVLAPKYQELLAE